MKLIDKIFYVSTTIILMIIALTFFHKLSLRTEYIALAVFLLITITCKTLNTNNALSKEKDK